MLSHTAVNLVSCAPLADGFIPSDPALFVPSPYGYTHGCEIQQRSALPAHVTYPLTTNLGTINNHCSLTDSAILQCSGIRDIAIGGGVFRDAVPRLQQYASYLHSVVRFRATRVVNSHLRLFWANLHDIQNSQRRYMHMRDIRFHSNLCIWRVWIEINLRSQVNYDFHSADFHDTQDAKRHYVQISFIRFSFKMEEKLDNLGKISITSSHRHSTALIFMTLSFSVPPYGDFIHQGRFYTPRFAQIYREICWTRVQIHLWPYVMKDCYWPHIHETHTCLIALCKEFVHWITWKFDDWFSQWY